MNYRPDIIYRHDAVLLVVMHMDGTQDISVAESSGDPTETCLLVKTQCLRNEGEVMSNT